MSQIFFSDSAPTTGPEESLDSFGRFTNANLERDFRVFSHAADVGYAQVTVGMSLAFLALLFNDYLFYGSNGVFWQLVVTRTVVFLISLASLIAVSRVSVKMFDAIMVFWSMSVVTLELFVVTARPPGFFGVIASTSFIISVFYLLLPQPLVRQFVLAGALSLGHLIISLWVYPITDPLVANTFMLVIFACNAVGFFSSRSTQSLKRRQYLLSKELSASERHYRTLVNADRGLVWTILADGSIDFVSDSGLRTKGNSTLRKADLGSISSVIHPDDYTAFVDRVKEAISTVGEMEWTGRLMYPNGSYRWVLTRMTPLSGSPGEAQKWIGTTTDIHELWTARNELAKANEHLQISLARVRQLETLLAICSFCKKIRDENGHWQNIDSYISHRSETRFSHGVCPGCGVENYGDVWENAMDGAAN